MENPTTERPQQARVDNIDSLDVGEVRQLLYDITGKDQWLDNAFYGDFRVSLLLIPNNLKIVIDFNLDRA